MEPSVDQVQLDRRLKMAQMLREQAMQPDQQQMAGGYVIPYSPFQGLAKLAQGYVAGQMEKSADKQRQEMASERNTKIAEALKNYGKVTDTTSTADGMQDFQGKPLYTETPQTRSATPDEQMQQDWQLAQLDPSFSKILESRKAREDTQASRLEQIRLANELKKDQMKNDARPFNQIVYTKDGAFSFDARSREVNPLINPATGKQIMGAQYDPSLQGEISGAKLSGESTAKRDINMSGLGSTIDRAKEILSAKDGPTSSLTGAGRDVVAGAFGVSTKGAEQADALEAIGGNLVSKMPRMEGPQSNIDVENYRIMAGRVGDRTLPTERRLAALKEVEALYRKYDKQNTPAPSGGAKFLGFE
jgi:hypothetical protein